MSSKREKVATPVVKAGIGVAFLVGKAALLVPYTRRKIYKTMKKLAQTEDENDFKDTLFSKEMYKTVVKQVVMDVTKTLKRNCVVPNFTILQLKQQPQLELQKTEEKDMKSIERRNVPLVISFGSCS